jgi:hypothetical protein
MVLQAKDAPDLDATNGQGITLRELMKAAIEDRMTEPSPGDNATPSLSYRQVLQGWSSIFVHSNIITLYYWLICAQPMQQHNSIIQIFNGLIV